MQHSGGAIPKIKEKSPEKDELCPTQPQKENLDTQLQGNGYEKMNAYLNIVKYYLN